MPPKRRPLPPGSTIPLVPSLDPEEWEEQLRPIEYAPSSSTGPEEIDITLQTKANGGYKFLNDAHFPWEIVELKRLAECNTKLGGLILACLRRDFTFVNWVSSSISRLPAVFQPENCALIQNFEVSVCRATKEHADTAFPMMLNVICTQLPCLTKFTVYEYRYENNITTDVERAIYQPMIRLLSFAVYRESPLNRMILPADSGPAFGEEHWRCKFYLVAEKGCGRRDWKSCTRWTDASKSKPKTYEDQVLNATAARHCKYAELLVTPIQDLIIHPVETQSKNDIATSEVPGSEVDYRLVDQRGYRTYREHSDNKWVFRSTDMLVELCRDGKSDEVVDDARTLAAEAQRTRGKVGRRSRRGNGRGDTTRGRRGRGGYSRGS
ncbi:hypothetical protein OHC33_009496 [Knufia fluminis]|uniref:Uncharacterized protein n=1 Tax=Knufia fluminis TaxID=191047 RepID=A0AAN8E9Z1_9EURO|nr:hypothetical protein OHC33_009496 [Knufia fluminis]